MKRNSIIAVIILGVCMCLTLTACNYPDVVEIQPSQTAFLIPMMNNTTNQGKFQSEEFLIKNLVASKRILVEKEWVSGNGYMPIARVIIVERKPETREWTESEKNGTSSTNEGLIAESKESIGFMARANCSAQIDESDAPKFLYRYNNKPLKEVMDTEIRAMIESKFVEECSKRTLDEIISNKGDIIKNVKDTVIPYFKDRGINVTVLGLKGELTYLNSKIQESIDAKFSSAQEVITQHNFNEKVLSKAKADAEAVRIQAETMEKSIRLKEIDNQSKAIDKWDGKMPQMVTNGNTMFNIPVK